MNRGNGGIILTIAVVVILTVVGFFIFTNTPTEPESTATLPNSIYKDSPDELSESETASDNNSLVAKSDEPTSMPMINSYVAYSPEALDEGHGKTRVLFFYANWCPTCIPVDNEFQANTSKIPDNTVVYRVNYNDNETDSNEEALAERYNITYQHTFVVLDNEGNEVITWNGGGLDKLLSELQ